MARAYLQGTKADTLVDAKEVTQDVSVRACACLCAPCRTWVVRYLSIEHHLLPLLPLHAQAAVNAEENPDSAISEEVQKEAGERDALKTKRDGLQSTLVEQRTARDSLVEEKAGLEVRRAQAQDSLDKLTAKRESLVTRLKALKLSGKDSSAFSDLRNLNDDDLLKLTGDDKATFEYLKSAQNLDDDGIAKATEDVTAELGETTELQDKAAREVNSLTSESAELEGKISAADVGIEATEGDLAATEADLDASEAALQKTLTDGAAKKESFCKTSPKTCIIPLAVVKGAAIYTLMCEVIVPKVIKPALIHRQGRPTCVWSSKAGPPPSDNPDP